MKRHRVTPTVEERAELGPVLERGKADARRLKRAQMLLKADAEHGHHSLPRRGSGCTRSR